MKFAVITYIVFICSIGIIPAQNNSDEGQIAYYCPPCHNSCDDLEFETAGKCTHCGMVLLQQNEEQRTNTMSLRKMIVGFYLQDGVEVLDFAGPMEVFSYAGFKVVTISKFKNAITSQGILKVIPEYSIEDAPDLDILATFGGNSNRGFDDKVLVDWVKAQVVDYHFSVCTGAFLLAKAGILDGLQATTFHQSIDNLQNQFPAISVLKNVRYVDNSDVITTAGISAGIDGALHLVHKLYGLDVAKAIATNMEYDKWIPEEGLIVQQKH